ncbi:MAG TPA: translation initiation factor IF-2 [Candidatus Saccharimonadales bacterium]|nr:translation initiation factor IF-2 [Candidatus Saccharimonadales bacterium]
MADEKKVIQLPEEISVRSLSSLLKYDPTRIITALINGGIMATINQSLDYDTAALIAEEFGYVAEPETQKVVNKTVTVSKNATERAPIVTIMGHVDHGKTSLLDFIRSANVAAGETGGITQHISAYQIDFKTKEGPKRKITFVDTPGHEAFSALRAHGAALTDVVILVVAADDGVKPQTLEAIEHAKGANVPIVVAINKADLPGANPDRVKQQLSDAGLVPEEWGGPVSMVPVSAKTGDGVDNLLEIVLLTTDLLELKADAEALPEGIVIEANLDKQVGPLAVVLMYNGTLRTGQVVVVGKAFGRVRAILNDLGGTINHAGPAMPVQIQGLKDVPKFGDRLEVVPNEKVARAMTQTFAKAKTGAAEDANTYRIIIKADVGGSLSALEGSISKLKNKDAFVEIISGGIGAVTENDINLAKPSKALIVAFRVLVNKRMVELAEKEGVVVKEYGIIYEVIEFLQSEIKRIATPVLVKTEVGRLKVLAVFSRAKGQAIVGGEVIDGEARQNLDLVIYRDKEEIGTAKASSLKLGKIETDKVEKGEQCGVSVEGETVEIDKGDILAFVETKEE